MREEEKVQKEEAIKAREKALLEKENRLYAIRAIKAAGLDDGSDKALALADLVMAEDMARIDEKVLALGEAVKALVRVQVDRMFKESGRVPARGAGPVGENPYARENYNLTKQMLLEADDPEAARALWEAAGRP